MLVKGESWKMAEKKNGWTMTSISLLLTAFGLLAGVWQYRHTNSQQYKKEIWSAQKKLYERAIAAASEIANGKSLESVAEPRKKFWKLYWGNLALLESPNVSTAMVKFGEILGDCEKSNDKACFRPVPGNLRTILQVAALDLAHCARASLQKTWHPVDIGKLDGQCPY
jgi:hypothetical protein